MLQSTNPTPPNLVSDITAFIATLPAEVKIDDRMITAIKMCIDSGVDTKSHIISVMMRAGFENNRKIAAVLDSNTGPAPNAHHWKLGNDGRYQIHSEPL